MIKDRISALEKRIGKLEPCGMTVTLADGREIITDGGGAVDLLWAGEPILMVESNTTGNGVLAELISELCKS